jgi:hypothetical protein
VTLEWVHARCGKAHPLDADCPTGTDTQGDVVEVAGARLAAVSGLRDDLKRRLEAGHPPTAKDLLLGLDRALMRNTLAGPRVQDVAIEPDEQGFATVHHDLDTEQVTAARAWTEDGRGCAVVSCTAFGVDEVEILTAPEARRVRIVTLVQD